jgi:murein DD-endopeptidase MepM/ murein hydrolase activator NlpD
MSNRTSVRLAVTVSALVALMGTACGQLQSVHRRSALAIRPAASRAADPATPNGENTGPSQPGPGYIVVTVVKKGRSPRIDKAALHGTDPIHICPVQGRGYFSDDFGAPRTAGGFHHHQGNDMFAETGTPIVAPFDGRAVATPNGLGGNAVTVYGAEGYVYNAHLVRYGQLGPVKEGTVVGYVGNTGDASGGPWHDHFEWHPNAMPAHPWISPYGFDEINGAIDPYPFLVAVCT